MTTSQFVSYWAFWLFLYGIATVPTALFGGIMAGSYIYNYDHAHRNLWNRQEYVDTLSYGEVAAAFVCVVPGFTYVAWSQLKDWCKEREKLQARHLANAQDDTVWPPAPLE